MAWFNLSILQIDSEEELDRAVDDLKGQGLLDSLEESLVSVLTNGSPMPVKQTIIRLLASRLLEEERAAAIQAHPELAKQCRIPETGIMMPSGEDFLTELQARLRRFAMQLAEVDENQGLEYSRDSILSQLTAEQNQRLLGKASPGDRELLTNKVPIDANKTYRRQLNRAIERLRGWIALDQLSIQEIEERRQKLVTEHPELLSSATGDKALALVLPFTGSSGQSRDSVLEALDHFDRMAGYAARVEGAANLRLAIMEHFPFASALAVGREWYVVHRPIQESIDHLGTRGTPAFAALSAVERLLLELKEYFANTEEEAQATFNREVLDLEETYSELMAEYEYLVGGMRPGFKQGLLLHGPREMVDRLFNLAMDPIGAVRGCLDEIPQTFEALPEHVKREARERFSRDKANDGRKPRKPKVDAARRARQIERSQAGPKKGPGKSGGHKG